ncbi:hypothetical protein [Aeromicrobium sp. P5_D10]
MTRRSMVSGRPHRPKTNAVLGVVDQGISSVTNFGVVIVAAVALSPGDFGAFSATFIVAGLLVACAQAIIGQELVLTRETPPVTLARCRDALLFAVCLGLGLGLLVFAAAWLFGDLRSSLLVLSATIPLLLVQDTVRYCASLLHSMHIAVIADAAWLGLGAVGIAGLHLADIDPSPTAFIAIWTVAGSLSGVFAAARFIEPALPRPTLARFRARTYLGYRFIWEFLALRASSQTLILILGVLAGLSATGAFRGATTLFGPLTVVVLATTSFGAPVISAVRASRRDTALLLMAGGLLVACLTLTAVLWLLPQGIGERLLGDTWTLARDFVVPIGVQTAFTSISTVAFLALRIVDPRATLSLRLYPAALMVPLFFLGYWIAGTSGAAWAIALTSALQSALALTAYLRRRHEGRGVGGSVSVPG